MNTRNDAQASAIRHGNLNSIFRRARQGIAASRLFLFCLASLILVSLPVAAAAMQEEDATRQLWDTGFLQKRPAPKTPVRKARQQIRYRAVTPASPVAPTDAVVGVTVWRLRPSTATDDQEVRQLIREQGEWTPERISAGAPLQEGQRVQLTIESPRSGYLYVFDRELYADKSFGDPYLIFPDMSINGGENKVSAGRVIEVPSSEDKPPYYTIKRSRPDNEGEVLTVLVTDKPLSELVIGRGALKLSKEKLAEYEKRWGAQVQTLELVGGAGTAMTGTEKAAGAGKLLLTQNDAPPQTIYRVQAKSGAPLLLTVLLRIGKASDN